MKKFFLKFKKWILTILGIGTVVVVVLFGGTSDDTTVAKLADKYDKATEIKSSYVLDGATLKATPKDNPKDRIEVTIGNKPVAGVFGADTNFEPTVTIARWDDEVNLSIKPKDFDSVALKDRTLKFDKEKVIFETPKVNYLLYELPISKDNPEGGFEYQVDLKEQPKSNVIEFTLQDKDVEYFYQPELTAEEIAQGASQPENVIGSYAVYAKTPKTNWTGGKEYKVGKVGHIYRPKIIDSAGTEVWGDLHIENGILSVTIPQDFLDKAVYPVRHAAGLTFGYNGTGGTKLSGLNDDPHGYRFTGAAGTVQKITIYTGATANDTFETTSDHRGFIVDFATEAIITNGLGASISITEAGNSAQWRDSVFSTNPTISAQDYALSIVQQGGLVGNSSYYDTGTSNYSYNETNLGYNPPDLSGGLTFDDNKRYFVYATYTAGGGAAVVEDPPIIIITD